MKCKKFILSLFIIISMLPALFSSGKKDISDPSSAEPPKIEEIKKDHFQIDLYLDTKKENIKNHFNWHTSSAKFNDSFDAVSGASKVHSTHGMREFFFDKSAKDFTIPKGLYCLCLYAVSDFTTLQKDDFKITQDGKKLLIFFSHRGISYKIESDDNGIIKVPDSFFILTNKASEDKKSEGEKGEYTKDLQNPSLSQVFGGQLKALLSADGIFTLSGKLNLTESKMNLPEVSAPKSTPKENI